MYFYPFHWVGDEVTGYDRKGVIQTIEVFSTIPFDHYQWMFIDVENEEVINDCPDFIVESPEVWMYYVDVGDSVDAIITSKPLTHLNIPYDKIESTATYYGVTRQIRYSDKMYIEGVSDIDVMAFVRRYSIDINSTPTITTSTYSTSNPSFITSAIDLLTFCDDNKVVKTVLTLADACSLSISEYLTLSDKEIADALVGRELIIEDEVPEDVITLDNKVSMISAISFSDATLAMACFTLPVAICAIILSSDAVGSISKQKFRFWKEPIKRVKTRQRVNEWTKSYSS